MKYKLDVLLKIDFRAFPEQVISKSTIRSFNKVKKVNIRKIRLYDICGGKTLHYKS